MLWFQAPFLPEWLSQAADCSFIEQALRTGTHAPSRAESIFTDEDVERYETCFGKGILFQGILVMLHPSYCCNIWKGVMTPFCVPEPRATPLWHSRGIHIEQNAEAT